MHYPDTRFGKAMMERHFEDHTMASRRTNRGETIRSRLAIRLAALRNRLGVWLIARGEKLAETDMKLA